MQMECMHIKCLHAPPMNCVVQNVRKCIHYLSNSLSLSRLYLHKSWQLMCILIVSHTGVVSFLKCTQHRINYSKSCKTYLWHYIVIELFWWFMKANELCTKRSLLQMFILHSYKTLLYSWKLCYYNSNKFWCLLLECLDVSRIIFIFSNKIRYDLSIIFFIRNFQ